MATWIEQLEALLDALGIRRRIGWEIPSAER